MLGSLFQRCLHLSSPLIFFNTWLTLHNLNIGNNENDNNFDQIVGVLQEILLEPDFETMLKKFKDDNCMQFEATEENKLCYMDIFKKYQETIETYLSRRLTEEITDFKMEDFMESLKDRKDEIDEQIMDLLLSFSEFEMFKEEMLFARAHLVATTPKLKSGKAAALGLKDSVSAKRSENNDKMDQGDMKHFEDCIDGLQIMGQKAKKL